MRATLPRAVHVQGLVPGRYERSARCEPALPQTETIELARTLERHFELELGLEVRGRVLNAAGQAVAGAKVGVQPLHESDAPLPDANALAHWLVECTSDADGEFVCPGLRAGLHQCSLLERRARLVQVDVSAHATARVVLQAEPAASIRFRFDRRAPEQHGQSREAVLAQAKRVSELLRAKPERFAELQQQNYSSPEPTQWWQGRGLPPLEAELGALELGQIALEPLRVDSDDAFLLVRRLDPSTLPAPIVTRAQLELPSPARPDVGYLSSEGLDRPSGQALLAEIGEHLRALGDARLLGEVDYERWRRWLDRRIEERMLLEPALAEAARSAK